MRNIETITLVKDFRQCVCTHYKSNLQLDRCEELHGKTLGMLLHYYQNRHYLKRTRKLTTLRAFQALFQVLLHLLLLFQETNKVRLRSNSNSTGHLVLIWELVVAAYSAVVVLPVIINKHYVPILEQKPQTLTNSISFKIKTAKIVITKQITGYL